MAIKYLDKITSGIPTTIIEGKDVSNVMLINPPSLPPFLMVNKAVLDTASNSIKVYDESGNFSLEIDLSKAELTPVIEAIEAVDARVDDTNSNVSDITLRIETNEGSITSINAEISRVEGKLDTQILRIDTNENEVSEVRAIANAADILSKDNASRLNAIDPDDVGDLIQQVSDNKSDIADIKSDQEIDQAAIKDNADNVDEIKDNIAALNLEISAANELAGEAKEESEEAKGIAGSALAKANDNAGKIKERDEDIKTLQAYLSGLEGKVDSNEEDIKTNTEDIKTATANAATAQARADSAYEKAKAAQDEAIGNSVAIAANSSATAANKVQLTSQKEQIRILEGTAAANTAEIHTVKKKARRNQLDIDVLEQQLPKVEAKADDALSKAETNSANIDRVAELADEKFEAVSDFMSAQEDVNKATGENFEAVESKIGTMDTDRAEIRGIAEGNSVDIGLIQTKLGIEGLGGYFIQGEDLLAGSIFSDGVSSVDEFYTPPSSPSTVDADKPTPLGGTHQFYVKNSDGSYSSLLDLTKTSVDLHNKPITNVSSGGDTNTNAATIGDVKTLISGIDDKGLVPVGDKWNMQGYPMVGVSSAGYRDDETGSRISFEEYKTKILADDIQFVTQNDTGHYVDINYEGVDVNNLEIKNVRTSTTETSAATVGQVNVVDAKVDALVIPPDNSDQVEQNASDIAAVKTTADDADALSKTNASTLGNALIKDDYGWDVNQLNVYNVSRISRTDTPNSSSGVSLGDADVNLHGDTVGITSANSFTTYAVFNAGGLNLNDYPLTRMASGGDTETNAANIGDVKRISASGSGLKPTEEQWDMSGYPVINIGTSEVETSASTVGQVNAVDSKVESVKSTAEAADTLSKDNKQRLDNLPPSPDLSGYVKNGEDVNFGTAEINITKITKDDDSTKFSDILIDGNTNTQMNFVGDTHFFVRDKSDNSRGLEAFQVDSSARFVAKQKVKTPIITNLSSGTTNTNSDKAAFIDLSVENEVKLGAKSKVSFHVAGNEIMEAAAAGFKLLRDANANNHTISKMGDLKFSSGYRIEGGSTGNLEIRNANGLYKNDSTDNNSIHFEEDDLKYKAGHHMFYKNASTSQLFGISDAGANLFNHNLKKVKHILANDVGSMNVSGVHILKRDDTKDTNQSIQFNASDITSYSDKHEWKTNDNARRLTIENHEADWHDCALTGVNSIWGGSNDNTNGIKFETGTGNVKNHHYAQNHIFFNNEGQPQFEILPTGPSAHSKTVRYVGQGSADTDATNLGHIKELIAASGGGGGAIEFKKIKKNVTGSPQYVYHSGDNHMFIEYTGNAGTISLDTMRKDVEDQVEDMFVVHNKTDVQCQIRLFFNNESVLHNIAPRSFSHGWANREIGQWVVTSMQDPLYTPEQRVIKISDLNYNSNSDPRQVTRNIINAMPINTILIARHEKGSKEKDTANKNRFISRGDANACESEECIAIIVKHSTDRATGMSTTQGGSGKAWSRVLDGKRHAWYTNDTANTFSVAEDIDLDQYPEDQLFLTGDLGMMKSAVDEEGDATLVPIQGYNVPQQEQDIQALQAEAESNKVITKIFKNESLVTIPYTQEHPVVEVFVLDGSETINGSGLTLIDDNTHKYSGVYNTVGSVSLYDNKWTTFSYHNAYKHDSENYYVVFDQSLTTWVILDTSVPHTSIGDDVGSDEKISLDHTGLLPESFGDYTITLSIDDVSSLEFIKAEANTRIDSDAKTVIVDFGLSKPSGKIIIK